MIALGPDDYNPARPDGTSGDKAILEVRVTIVEELQNVGASLKSWEADIVYQFCTGLQRK